MSVAKLLHELNSKGVQLNVNKGKLNVKAPVGALDDTLKAELKTHKSILIDLLEGANLKGDSSGKTITSTAREQPLLLSFAQQRLWFLHQLDPESYAYNISATLLLHGELNYAALRKTFNALFFRHEILRTVYVKSSVDSDSQPLQKIQPIANVDLSAYLSTYLSAYQGTMSSEAAAALSPIGKDRVTSADNVILPEGVKEWLSEHSKKPFDLTKDAMMRVQLVPLNYRTPNTVKGIEKSKNKVQQEEKPHLHLLQWVIHHIAVDEWSIGIIVQEFASLYHLACEHEHMSASELAVQLPAQDIQYADFAMWQRDLLQGAKLERQISFWRKALGEQQPVLALPTDNPRPTMQSFNGDYITFELSEDIARNILNLSQGQQGIEVSPFILLLGTYQKLLQQYSGQDDIRVGVPNANRNSFATQTLIGFFVNTLVMRSQFNDNFSVADFFAYVKEQTLAAQEHQEIPFEMLVDELVTHRDMSHSPLFQVMFNFLQGDHKNHLTLDGVEIQVLPLRQTQTKFDVTLTIEKSQAAVEKHQTQHDSIYTCTLEFNKDLFTRERMLTFSRHYQHLLQQITHALLTEPQRPLSRVSALDHSDYQQQLHGWNNTAQNIDFNKDAIALFEQQVQRTPEAIAAVWSDIGSKKDISFQELNEKSNRLAHYLTQHYLAKINSKGESINTSEEDILIAVCLDRNEALFVALLAIQKAGCAYLPVDPKYPLSRRHYILEHAKPHLILTESTLLPVIAETLLPQEEEKETPFGEFSLPWLTIDGTRWRDNCGQSIDIASLPIENLLLPSTPEQLAYTLYTSGSTGKPKGVQISRGAFVNFLMAMQKEICLQPEDKWLAVTTISFDIAGLELFLPLITGASVVVASSEQARDPQQILSLLQQQSISIMQATPATWHMLVDYDSSAWQGLKVLCGGEALSAHLANRLLQRNVSLLNVYGPTETTVWSTCYPIVKQLRKMAPLGRPIGNSQCYVLDRFMQPVPVGTLGELYIGGHGLARGYLYRSDLTGAAFVKNPFDNTPGTHLYRTGDIVKYRPDGILEYCGRGDFQVKIRGFRVELGEIELQLNKHPNIYDAVVNAYDDGQGVKHLVAYLQRGKGDNTENREPLDQDALRTYLAGCLPDYMIPSLFVMVATLPLNSNGKIDRNALPAPDFNQINLNSYIAPRNDEEQRIAYIWADILKVKKIGVDDNFFSLGGNSLSATKVVTRITEELSFELPLRQFFLQPTVAELALLFNNNKLNDNHVDNLASDIKSVDMPVNRSISKAPDDINIPLSFSQQRLWFLHQLEGPSCTYNMPAAIAITGTLDHLIVQQSFEYLVSRHTSLRTYFPTHKGESFQQLHDANNFSIAWQDLRSVDPSGRWMQARLYAKAFASCEFDLERQWLFSVKVLQFSDDEHWLLVNCHHIIADGWSMGLLINEFTELYQQIDTTGKAYLQPLTVQYSDYAYWQHHTGAERCHQQLDYWLQQLADPPTLLSLPTDHGRPAQQSYRGECVSVSVDQNLAETLGQFAIEQGCTQYMVLLAAWQVLLHRYSGQNDICVGSPVANRQHSQIEPIVGFFANTLVMRGDLSEAPNFIDFLKQIRRATIDAQAHQDVPFEQIVEKLNVARTQAYSPIFQVMFTWQNTPLNELESLSTRKGALSFNSAIEDHTLVNTGTSKFDLDLSLREYEAGISGQLDFNSDLFNRSTIKHLWQHFIQLLNTLTTHPHISVSRVPFLLDDELTRQEQWNATTLEYSRDQSVAELFEQSAKMHGDKIAARFADSTVTYKQLDASANQLAHYLQQWGVGADTLVAVCQRRSLSMLISLLAVLKAGGGYVPIDPTYPKDRIVFMLENSDVDLILTDQSVIDTGLLIVSEELYNNSDQVTYEDRIINVDKNPHIANAPASKPSHNTDGDHLAYVIYTSGSTGKPKGVQISRANMTNFINGMRDLLPIASDDKLLAVTSLSFDIAVLELYLPLVCGSQVVIGDETLSLDGLRLKKLIQKEAITFMQATPVSWKILLAAGWQYDSSQEKPFNVLCGGERFPTELACLLLDRANQKQANPQQLNVEQEKTQTLKIWNLYGPTETCVWSTAYEVTSAQQPIPIGRPIANTQVYILDAALNPVPIGVAGELYIAGDGLARGYLGRSDLTGERFITSSLGRLYKTGDMARYRADGVLECLGRLDHQVKIRGYRIELGEIETCLAAHDSVSDVVVYTQSMQDKHILVGYVVLNHQQTLVTSETADDILRSHLQHALPEYMIPTVISTLQELPLTPNGKVDRKRLPKVDLSSRKNTYSAPVDDTEIKLQGIWQALLDIETIGTNDNFFDLGGHSLLAVRLLARSQEIFPVKLDLVQLFDAPTIAGMAYLIRQQLGTKPDEVKGFKNNVVIDNQALDRIDELLMDFEDD